ncbi:MAG: hypothetical protein ACLP1X_33275 [Polyangiaceae bacterium]|jgi:hypothetical protein
MKRVCGHVLAGLTVLAGGASMTSACVHDDSTIFVFDVLAPQEVSNGQLCTYNSDTTQNYLSSGTADIDFIDGYVPTYLVGNQMVPQENPSTPQDETSYVTIQGAIVRITDSAGNQLTTFTRLTSGPIPPLSGTTPSFTPISVLTIDHATLDSATVTSVVTNGGIARLVTYVRFFGQTTGGDSVESGEFEFPVDVCKGCLIAFAPQDISQDYPAPNCAGAIASSTTGSVATLPIPCTPGQDIPIDCSQCQSIPDCSPNGPYNK